MKLFIQLMTFIQTMKQKHKHSQTPRDIYFTALEEAYGNLPVPSDDYADIKNLLKDKNIIRPDYIDKYFKDLEKALYTIAYHYEVVARALNKPQKWG